MDSEAILAPYLPHTGRLVAYMDVSKVTMSLIVAEAS